MMTMTVGVYQNTYEFTINEQNKDDTRYDDIKIRQQRRLHDGSLTFARTALFPFVYVWRGLVYRKTWIGWEG